MHRVVALALPDVVAFDLSIAAQIFGHRDEASRYDFVVCAPAPGPVPSSTGFAISATRGHGPLRDPARSGQAETVTSGPDSLDHPGPARVRRGRARSAAGRSRRCWAGRASPGAGGGCRRPGHRRRSTTCPASTPLRARRAKTHSRGSHRPPDESVGDRAGEQTHQGARPQRDRGQERHRGVQLGVRQPRRVVDVRAAQDDGVEQDGDDDRDDGDDHEQGSTGPRRPAVGPWRGWDRPSGRGGDIGHRGLPGLAVLLHP